jgi:hypothetical protein
MVRICFEISDKYYQKFIETVEKSKKVDPTSPFLMDQTIEECFRSSAMIGRLYIEKLT